MIRTGRRLVSLALIVLVMLIMLPGGTGAAYAQISTSSSLSGVVVDSDGGVLPGASVAIKNDATGDLVTEVTNAAGVFSAPSLRPGSYTVTVTLQGFKNAVVKNVALTAGTPANLPKISLALGTLEESIEVVAHT